ncbi:MAG: HD domain-containing protein [Oscillospiraceae bacterium]|nr:HD domain-containing protein [Oscillospiraceae bacterium]
MSYCLCRELHISPVESEQIYIAALFHDIGKIRIPLEILHAPRKLTRQEQIYMEQHPVYGAGLAQEYGFPLEICDWIRWHHERMDGSGYPDRLRGGEIPMGVRIISICDVLHALLQKRPYKEALPPKVCKEMLLGNADAFDGDVLRVVALFWESLTRTAAGGGIFCAHAPAMWNHEAIQTI